MRSKIALMSTGMIIVTTTMNEYGSMNSTIVIFIVYQGLHSEAGCRAFGCMGGI